MSLESKTDFFCTGIRPTVANFDAMKGQSEYFHLPPIKIDNFTKNDGADYLLHIKKGEFNLCEGKNLEVALSCSGLNKDTYKKKILDRNSVNHPSCIEKVEKARREAKKECEQKKIENSEGVDGTIVAKLKFGNMIVNGDTPFFEATKIEKDKKIIMEIMSDIKIKDPKFQFGIIKPSIGPYTDCKLNEDKKGFICEYTPTSDTIPEEGQVLQDVTEFEIKATTDTNGNEVIVDNKNILGWKTFTNDENTENTQEDTGGVGAEIPKPSPAPAPAPAPGPEGFGNMFPLQGICVDEKKQICLFLFLILVSFVVLNIDDILKKVRKFMKKLVC